MYASKGPYLTKLVVDTDMGVAVLNQPVAIEIRARRASVMNVTAGIGFNFHNSQMFLETSYHHSLQNMCQYSLQSNQSIVSHSEFLKFTSGPLRL